MVPEVPGVGCAGMSHPHPGETAPTKEGDKRIQTIATTSFMLPSSFTLQFTNKTDVFMIGSQHCSTMEHLNTPRLQLAALRDSAYRKLFYNRNRPINLFLASRTLSPHLIWLINVLHETKCTFLRFYYQEIFFYRFDALGSFCVVRMINQLSIIFLDAPSELNDARICTLTQTPRKSNHLGQGDLEKNPAQIAVNLCSVL